MNPMAIHHIAQDLAGAEWQPHELPVLSGAPKFARSIQFISADGLFVAGTWESEPGVLKLQAYPVVEYCKILHGELCIREDGGGTSHFGPGSAFVIPLGFTGQWEMMSHVRKEFVVRRSVPVPGCGA